MDKLIEYGMWPLAVVMVAVVSLGMFRTPIAGAINRIRKIGGGDKAIEISDMSSAERQQQQIQSAPPIRKLLIIRWDRQRNRLLTWNAPSWNALQLFPRVMTRE